MKKSFKINKRRISLRLVLITLAVLIIIATGAVLLARYIYHENLKPVSTSQKYVTVTIPLGSTTTSIADILKEKGLIRNSGVFVRYVRNQNLAASLKAGTYSLQPSQSVPEIVSVLTQGKIQTNLFQILPGERIDQVRANLINSGYSEADTDKALQPSLYRDHPALSDMPSSVTSLEGYLYPETIHKTAETPPEQIIRKFLDEMQKRLTPEIRNGIVAQGLTVHDGIILASIIENEVPAANPEDRPRVAQVFLSRLRSGIKLESDATRSYGVVLDLNPNPYDTYNVQGLTPTPISNVSETSLGAVANPANTNWFYFVSGKDCITRFSATLGEHETLVKQYGLSTQSDTCK